MSKDVKVKDIIESLKIREQNQILWLAYAYHWIFFVRWEQDHYEADFCKPDADSGNYTVGERFHNLTIEALLKVIDDKLAEINEGMPEEQRITKEDFSHMFYRYAATGEQA